jgi:hypothetical protein
VKKVKNIYLEIMKKNVVSVKDLLQTCASVTTTMTRNKKKGGQNAHNQLKATTCKEKC